MEQNPNIYFSIKQNAERNHDKALISVDQNEITYGRFIENCDAISKILSNMGVVPQQKIGLIIPNSLLWYEIFWAAVKLGAQPVPLDPQIGEWEMARLLSLTEVTICFAAANYRSNPILDNVLKVKRDLPYLQIISIESTITDEDVLSLTTLLQGIKTDVPNPEVYTPNEADPLMLACTSGSTGNPKVIVVPHMGFCKAQADMADYLGFCQNDVMLLGMPLYHQGGFGMGLQMILNGGTVIYQPVFDPVKFLTTIHQRKITVIQLTTTLAKIILSVPDFHKYDLSSVHTCYFAGEVLPVEVAREFYEKLKIRVVNIIGSSETATMVVWDSNHDQDVDVNEFRALTFTQVKLLNETCKEVMEGETGTIFIHTDALIKEYFKNPTETDLRIINIDEIKWFNTGDLAIKRPYGRVRFAGRAKRIIKRGSNLIYPEEIEAFLLTHPDIEAIAVVGQKHELIGEMIIAHIQSKKGILLTRGDILKFCHGKLAAYKVPDQVILTEEIPNDIGKIQFKYLNTEGKGDSYDNE